MDKIKLFENKNLGLLLGSLGVALTCAALVWWVLSPSWTPIVSGEQAIESSADIQSKLMEWNVPFKVDASTSEILVDSKNVITVRARLNDAGFPQKPAPGLEIFSEAEYGMSEFTQKINFQRAMEAELAKTIKSIPEVNHARVHITIPKESIFIENTTPPKASVSIKTSKGYDLSQEQIRGIVELVASSVEGLSSENVKVLDQYGLLVSSGAKKEKNGVDRNEKSALENYYKNKIEQLLSGLLPDDNFRIAVEATYNFDKVKSIKEQIIPKDEGDIGYLKNSSQNTTSESSNGEGASSTSESRSDKTYVYSKERSEIEYATGTLAQLNVGIVILETMPAVQLNEIKAVISSGIGLTPDRGDTINVAAIPAASNDFVAPSPKERLEKNTPDESTNSTNHSLVDWANDRQLLFLLGGVVLFLVLILVLLLLNQLRLRKRAITLSHRAQLSSEEREKLLHQLQLWLSSDKGEAKAQ